MTLNGVTVAPSDPGALDRIAVALQDRTRRGILLGLLRDTGPRTVDEVADRAGVHRTVAFGHLQRLVDLGLLRRDVRRGRLGKPAALYSPAAASLTITYPPRQFALLAGLLAAGLAAFATDGVEAARAAGRRFGEQVGDAGAESVGEALRALHVLGADYVVRDGRVEASPCVFLEACAQSQGVVCGLHAGILEGALRAASIDVAVIPTRPEGAAGCAFALGSRAG